MRKAISLFMALLLMTGFVAGLQRNVSAQGSTASGTSIIDSSGNEVASVTVDSILDPFDAYDPGYEPGRGFRYVMLTLTVENTGTTPFYPQPYGFTLVDSDGFISTSSYVAYDATAYPAPFPDAVIEAGDSVTGSVVFQLLAGAGISAITYSPSYDRLYLLASSGEEPVAGEPVSLLGDDGSEIGTVTIDEVTDPMTDFDPNYAAPRGYHYVSVTVTFENTSSRPITVDPSAIDFIDADGYISSYYGVYRTAEAIEAMPDITYADLAPGESITGVISYTIFNASAPAWLVLSGSGTQFVVLSTFDSTPVIPAIADIPTESAAPVTTPEVDETATVGETATATAELSAECQDLQTWSDDLNTAIEGLNSDATSVESIEDLENLTVPEINEQIDLLNDFLDAIEEIDTPDAAEDTYDALVDMIETQIDGFEAVADAKDNGDDLQPIYDQYNTEVDAAADAFYTEAAALSELCPTLS